MNVLSLFDGIAGAKVALDRAGIPITNYFASEVDPYAISIAKKNHPDIQHIGCVRQVSTDNIPQIDLLIGGSPCQGFSRSGNKKGIRDYRSRLILHYKRLLEECNPKYFLLENVVMSDYHRKQVSKMVGAKPIIIDSGLVSAQRRNRMYWTNIPDVTQPEDKKIQLWDVIERDAAYTQPELLVARRHYENSEVTRLADQFQGGVAFTEARTKESAKNRSRCRRAGLPDTSKRRDKILVPRQDDKMNCLTAKQTHRDGALLDENLNFRRLSPIECERLQTYEDNYTAGVSRTQRYKVLGNSFTVDVIAHILKHIM